VALLGFFIIFLYYTFGIARNNNGIQEAHTKMLSTPASILMVVGGLALLVLGGRWVVNGAVDIATALGVSKSLIGLTIVAVGTSLPELATSAVAAIKKKPDIAVGNVVGSNIFNIFFVLGISAIIRPLPFSPASNMDILVVIAATLLLFTAMFLGETAGSRWGFLGKKYQLDRWQGVTFVLFYVAYIAYLVLRG
jgi:cation:H+ antiporter